MAVTDPGELERGSLSVSASEPVDDQQDRLNELEAEQSNEKFRENELSRSGSIVKISVQHQSQTIEDPHKIHTPPEEQVLCVSNLATQVLQETNGQGEQEECGELFEIDLNREENRQIQPEEGAQMFMNYRCEEPVVSISIPVEPSQQFRGFADAPPKLSFASKRMKEYFESFKAHGSETVRVYQFFKSTRTELVACLLFTLITSQALITCRTQQLGSASTWPLKLQMPETQGKMGDNSGVKLSIGISTLVGRQQSMLADLAGGLVTSFTVASLTQVFGHISGCHLIPAVSLALYVKGHISRARLGSYLVAQSVGSILGVSMLSLLTSSQLTAREYREFLSTFEKRQHEPSSGQYQTASTMQTVAKQSNQRRRKRREASEDINLSDVQGSETILLSIMEQQENDRRQRGRQLERRNLEGKTITADVGGLQEGPLPMEATFGVEGGNAGLQSAQRQSLGATRTIESRSKLPPETRPLVNDKSRAHNDPTRALENSTDAGPWNGESGQRSRVQRRKRTRRQQQQQQIQVQDTGTGIGPVNETQLDSGHYLNLLEFSLPLPIMASESIRQCIDKQQQQQAKGGSQPSGQTMAQLASQSFNQCLLLSNSSQMFIFQLLATSLIVLTYLVNVDPRRTDLGFKSLSIGLAYFVASALTLQSGGFYGNPFHLLFLSLLSSAGEWHTEWFIYLVTPLIGGLFGAISHEYIDFTSLRNRNKQLHLRRSFFSLENLHHPSASMGANEEPASAGARGLSDPGGSIGVHTSDRRRTSSSSDNSDSVTPISIVQTHIAHKPDHLDSGANRRLGSSYSQQVRLEQERISRQAKANQLQQHQQLLLLQHQGHPPARQTCHGRANARQSDFDSNFLISSTSSPTANLPRWMAA